MASTEGSRVALIVDDEPGVRFVLSRALASVGLACVEAASIEAATALLSRPEESGPFAAAFVDIRLPDGSGLAVAARLAALDPRPLVVVMTAQDTVAHAIEATRLGADDYLVKPFALADVQKLGRTALERARMAPGEAATPADDPYRLVGGSAAMREVYKRVGRVCLATLPLVVEGEPGSGKELVARAVHAAGPRAAAPLVTVGAIAATALERGGESGSELEEAWRQACGGTLVLDEPAAWLPARQARLLALIGAADGVAEPQRPRLIVTSSQPLATARAEGRLPEPLALRLQVLTLRVPPLRERLEDLPALVAHLSRHEGASLRLSEEAMALLARHDWPGNVRQLAQLLAAARVEAAGEAVTVQLLEPLLEALPGGDRRAAGRAAAGGWEESLARYVRGRLGTGALHADVLARAERVVLEEASARAGGNQVKAAALLGLHRNSFRRRLGGAGGGGRS